MKKEQMPKISIIIELLKKKKAKKEAEKKEAEEDSSDED